MSTNQPVCPRCFKRIALWIETKGDNPYRAACSDPFGDHYMIIGEGDNQSLAIHDFLTKTNNHKPDEK